MPGDGERARDAGRPGGPGQEADPDLPDEEWNNRARDETDQDRLDRNFTELLQELRVAQAGVQILFAFLLSLAFTQRFGELSGAQRGIYTVALVASALAAALFIAPVSWHRLLFRRRRKHELVQVGNRCAVAGLVALAGSIAAAVLLVVDVVLGPVAATLLTVFVAGAYLLLWYALPLNARRHKNN